MSNSKFAQIQYHGEPGLTSSCVKAVVRLIQFGEVIDKASILTHKNAHCILLSVGRETIIIKSGFSSGYRGEGPRGLSNTLEILDRHGVEIVEYEVEERIIEAIDDSCLLYDDLENILSSKPILPERWLDYVYEPPLGERFNHSKLRGLFSLAVPLSLLDNRLIDLALSFDGDYDHSVLTGFRRLEDIVRSRINMPNESASRLFSKAFAGEDSILYWKNECSDQEAPEHNGRAKLFTSVYMACRNSLAHNEIKLDKENALRNFMLLNELFLLESQAVERAVGRL